jgi:type II secretion system protein C
MGTPVGTMIQKKYIIPFAVSTAVAVLTAVIILMVIDASLLRIPHMDSKSTQNPGGGPAASNASTAAPDYKAISERNLFRANLAVEIPKPKSEKEIEEELLTGILRTMTLKGVMIGEGKKDSYAVIDRGGQKGVWSYEIGEVVERGLAVKEIRKDAVVLQKDDFGALLRLFAINAERIPVAPAGAVPAQDKDTANKKKLASKKQSQGTEIRREGKTLVIPKTLAERIKNDNSAIMSSVAVKVATDANGQTAGYKVVAIDKESIVGKMGLKPNDTLQAVNGHSLKSGDDLKKLYDNLKNASRFELKVLRQGKPETIFYEIR